MSIQFEKRHSTSKREIIGSRLTPFEKLPRIGSSHEYIPHPPTQPKHSIGNPREKLLLKEEPILIAIKLSDGRRLQKQFYSNDKIYDIIKYVKSQQIHLDNDIYLSSGDIPKRQFQDFNLTLLQANITTHTMEIEEKSSVDFYRKLLHSAKIFLTEIDGQSSTSPSINESTLYNKNRSISPSISSTSTSLSSSSSIKDIDKQLILTRQQCHQRILTCSRKKLRLLSLQEQNDKRHYGFKKFVDNLDEKRSANIHRYQIELKDYLFKRLEADRLRNQLDLINMKIDQLKEEKSHYTHIIDIVQKAIPLFPPGLLQGGSEGVKSLISRYETLVETKNHFEQRDFSKEKQQRRLEFQKSILEHNTRIAKLSTRIAQLHNQLNVLQKNQSIIEEIFINQMDLKRSNTTIISQLVSSINYLYDRYRLIHQIKKEPDITILQKLRVIQEFILYRMDLVQRAKN